jgi:hypothetical protein
MTAVPVLLILPVLALQPPITGQVVDPGGKPVPGAAVVLSSGMARDGALPVVAGVRTDEAGRFTFKPTEFGNHPEIGQMGTIWVRAEGSDLALGIDDLLRNDRPGQVHRIVLEPAKVRRVTLRDSMNRPVAGARLSPRLVQTGSSRYDGIAIPDPWLDVLSVTTDAQGVAALSSLNRSIDLRTVAITLPGRERHVIPLPYAQGKEDATLTLGVTGRLAGRVEVPAGIAVPSADIELDVWMRCACPLEKDRTFLLAPEPVRFDAGCVRVGADGRFETPSVLWQGTTYRVVVRRRGFAPGVSNWVRLSGETATIPVVSLQPLRTIEGRVIDRQGRPIAAARVLQAGNGRTAETDSSGRFRLGQARPGPTCLIASCPGFRVNGLAAATSTSPIELTLSRDGKSPERVMATLPPPLPLDESRKLARRVLDPLLKEVLAKGEDGAKLWLLSVVRWIDTPGLLEHIEKTSFARTYASDFLRGEAALGLAAADPDEAVAVAETIIDPASKAGTLVDLVDALPASEHPRKLALLERAAAQARAASLGSKKFFQMGEVAEHWLELGEKDKALALFDEGRTLIKALTPEKRTDAGSFLSHMARVDAVGPLSLLKGVGTDRWNQRTLANLAIRLAFAFPSEAEGTWEQLHEPLWRNFAGLRICRRLARVDPERARRIAARFPDPGDRACAWTFLAEGLREIDRDAARAALDRAIAELDGLPFREGPGVWDPSPAASILPLVERIAPDRVGEVFWRAVTLLPSRDDPRRDLGRDDRLIDEAVLLSRYDREVASTLFRPVRDYVRSLPLRSATDDLTQSTIVALACLDPLGAVGVVEGLPPARSLDINDPTNWARCRLSELLAMPPDRRWLRIWRFHAGCGIAMFEEVYRDL